MHTNQEITEYLKQINLTKFDNSYDQACLFYFGLLRQLNLKLITAKIQIDNIAVTQQKYKKQVKINSANKIKEEINIVSNKIENMQKQKQKIENNHQFQCKVKGCGKIFEDKQTLQHHDTLKHKISPSEWFSNRIFNIQIKQVQQSSRRASRH